MLAYAMQLRHEMLYWESLHQCTKYVRSTQTAAQFNTLMIFKGQGSQRFDGRLGLMLRCYLRTYVHYTR